MALWRDLLGRRRAAAPNLDRLFLIPTAAITLETALGLRPTGEGSVCFRAPAGAGYDLLQRDVVALLRNDPDAPEVRLETDSFGFTWLTTQGSAGLDGPAMDDLCADLHAVNTSLEAQDFAGGLLCTLVTFADASGRRVGLVYLYKQGTFYAFAPAGSAQRDNLTEINIRDALADELPMEPEMSRWLAIWGAPGLA